MGYNEQEEESFPTDDCNGFYYTNDKQIRRIDDAFIMSKLIEKYPDFSDKSSENLLKQVFMIMAKDTKFIKGITEKYDITPRELFGIIYRNYSFLFGSCYVSKLQKLVSRRSYARPPKTTKCKDSKRAGISNRTKKGKGGKTWACKKV